MFLEFFNKIKEEINCLRNGYFNEKDRIALLKRNYINFSLESTDQDYFKNYLKKNSFCTYENIHFSIDLPFFVPLDKFSMCYMVVFDKIGIGFKYSNSKSLDNSVPMLPGSRALYKNSTKLDIVFHFLDENILNIFQDDDGVSNLLEISFHHINEFLRWASVFSRNYEIRLISFEMLPVVLPFKITDSDYSEKSRGMFLNRRKPNDKFCALSKNDMSKFVDELNFFKLHNKNNLKYIDSLYSITEGYRLILQGDFSGGVVLTHTGVETLLITLFKEISAIENCSLTYSTFSWLYKNKLRQLLKGNWTLDIKSYPGVYWNKCYKLRNRIVHNGVQPNYWEALNAYYSAENLLTFITMRLKANKKYHHIILQLPNVNKNYIPLKLLNDSLDELVLCKIRETV